MAQAQPTSLSDYLKKKNGVQSTNTAQPQTLSAQPSTTQSVTANQNTGSGLNLPTYNAPNVNTKGMSERDKQGAIAEGAQGAYEDFLKGSSEAYYQEQQALLEQARNQRLTELQKAYDQAVSDGKMSKEEAERQLTQEIESINADAYRQSQATELSGQTRGIGNSQQMLALQQGDARFANNQRSDARVARDERISKITERINQITNNYNLDVSGANSAYNTGLQQAQAQAMGQYNEGMANMSMEQWKSAQEMQNSLTMLDEQTRKQMEIMAKQQGYDLEKMSVQQKYQLAQMAKQQQYTQDNMAKQQEYTQENMNLQYKLDLGKMKTQHGYDMQKINTQYQQDLNKMAKQHGYDMSKLSTQHKNQLSQISAQKNASIAQANAQRDAEMQALRNSYLNPNSSEYKIREAQINEANEQAISQYYNKAMIDASATMATERGGKVPSMQDAINGNWNSAYGNSNNSSGFFDSVSRMFGN